MYLAFGLAKLFFPTLDRLLPERPILHIDRVPLKLAAIFNLLSEEILQIKWHGVQPDKNEAASPPDENGLVDLGSAMYPAAPSNPHPARRSDPKANCVQARAEQVRSIEILELLQVGHCFLFGGQAKSNCEVRDHHKIIRSTQFRPELLVLMIVLGTGG